MVTAAAWANSTVIMQIQHQMEIEENCMSITVHTEKPVTIVGTKADGKPTAGRIATLIYNKKALSIHA